VKVGIGLIAFYELAELIKVVQNNIPSVKPYTDGMTFEE